MTARILHQSGRLSGVRDVGGWGRLPRVPSWSAADVPDQAGRLAVVTGANSGIGLHTALGLARAGARVVLAVRNERRGRDALARLQADAPGARAEVRALDLADLASVRAFAEALDEPLDLLVNNAGVMAIPLRRTRDGFEAQLGTNHLGPFALTGRLLGQLLAAPAPRVVTVSSAAHRGGRIAFEDLGAQRRYRAWAAYGQSKLANLLFCLELQRRSDAAGAGLLSVAAHPGYAATNLQFARARTTGSRAGLALAGLSNRLLGQSAAQGALPSLYAATMPLAGAAYVGPDGPGEMRGGPTLVGRSDRASDEVAARRLWEVSERLTGVRFAFAAAA
jgi:NAD(P)-dependent dehydrogenase (short-subunit alcohol dehydrogenase family)